MLKVSQWHLREQLISKPNKLLEGNMQSKFIYPTNNKVLRFFGDLMLLIGSWFTTIGLRYGGVYELEFDEDDV